MIYKFVLISDEVDPFKREIQIDPDATFLDLLQIIYQSINYSDPEIASFFISNEDWDKKEEISLVEKDNNPEFDSWVMEETPLTEFIEDEQQRLMLQFDYPKERFFFIELSEIITGKNINKAKCTLSVGEAPQQYEKEDEELTTPLKTTKQGIDIDESFYGDQDFDSIEIEGFENLEDL